MEHVLLIWASPNRDGLTAAAKNAVLRGLAAGGARADEVWLNHCAMQRCMACGDGWGPVSYTHLDVYKRQPAHVPS